MGDKEVLVVMYLACPRVASSISHEISTEVRFKKCSISTYVLDEGQIL